MSQSREGTERMTRSNDAHAVLDGPRARRGYGTIEVRPRRDEGSPEFDERVRKALRAFARSPGVREFDSLWVYVVSLGAVTRPTRFGAAGLTVLCGGCCGGLA